MDNASPATVQDLKLTLEQVAEANVYAAELLSELEATRSQLEIKNLALREEIEERVRTEELLRTAKAAAEESNRCKSVFLATMSHELRTPLNAIIGYAELLGEELEGRGEPQFVSDVRRIREAGLHLTSVIGDILDLSKIEAGRIELSIEDVDVVLISREIVSTIAPLVQTNRNVLRLECAPDRVRADAKYLRQCLLNLLGNACKFTDDGSILFQIQKQDAAICFSVKDTGVGIPPDKLALLFEPCRQVDDSPSRDKGGTGLGLAITRRLAELMGGSITVESEPGAGSTFTMRLPAA